MTDSNIPGIVAANMKRLVITGTPFADYTKNINRFVEKTAVNEGLCVKVREDLHEYHYEDQIFRFTFIHWPTGSRHCIEVSCYHWDEIPTTVNLKWVRHDERWNSCYETSEFNGVERLLQHIPGSWVELLEWLYVDEE